MSEEAIEHDDATPQNVKFNALDFIGVRRGNAKG